MVDFLKIIMTIVVLYLAYIFLSGFADGGIVLNNQLGGQQVLQVTDSELWGNPSPLRGSVYISKHGTPTATNTTNEYIEIVANRNNLATINITGWSLHSVVSDTRVYLPPATLLLKMTERNAAQPVHLAPGEYAILHSGSSPISSVATSFHTNECLGYVSAFNDFVPKITSKCTSPSSILPPTPQNIKAYGAECVEFLAQAQPCRSYRAEMPARLLPACRELVARKLTYHSCIKDNFENTGYDLFNNGGWYLYLNHSAEIWRNNYEAIQLLDAEGKVVDVLRY